MSQLVHSTLEQRQKTHGDFGEQAAVTQRLKAAMRAGKNWPKLASPQMEALETIALKLGRILCGDPNHADSWHDIAGYATLVERIIMKETPSHE